MHHLIYPSWATVPVTDALLQELLAESRIYNALHEMTGVLLYGNGQFVQVLEGEEEAVQALYERIKRDPRHRDAVTYADKAIVQRAFGDWAMAFHPVTPQQAASVLGYLDPGDIVVDETRLHQADVRLLEVLRSFVFPIA